MRKVHVASFVIAIVAAIFLLGIYYGAIPASEEICDEAKDGSAKDCATYNAVLALLWHVGKFLDRWNTAIIAVATVVVGIFTATLWRSTDELRKAAIMQGEETKNSLRIAQESADAAKAQGDIAEQTLIATNRPWLTIPSFRNAQIIDTKDGILRVGATITLQNIGNSPAVDLQTFMLPLFNVEDSKHIADLIQEELGPFASYWDMTRQGDSIFHDREYRDRESDGGRRMPENFEYAISDWWLLLGVRYRFPFPPYEVRYTAYLRKVESASAVIGPIESERIQTYTT